MVYATNETKTFLLKEPENLFLSTLRIAVGFIMLWAFLDKLFGLGFSTAPKDSWINGSSPTLGFLKYGTNPHSPFTSVYSELAHYTAILDPIYMATLLFIGLTLISGVGVRIGSIVGIIFLASIYFSLIPLTNNPIIDKHFMYAIILLMLIFTNAGRYGWTLGRKWQNLEIVKKYPILK